MLDLNIYITLPLFETVATVQNVDPQPTYVTTIGIVGSGVMGAGIGQVAATSGFDVVLHDVVPAALKRAQHTIIETKFGLKRGVELGKISARELDAIVGRLSFTDDLNDLAGADLLIEAVPEDLTLKQAMLRDLDRIVAPAAIFASNTSGLAIEDIARDVSDQRRPLFAGMHFASPVPAMRMCEIVHTATTSATTIQVLRGVAERMGKSVCMVRDAPGTYGFILNRVFLAAYREAQRIVDDGIATPEDVDKAMMTGRNWPVGFFNSRGTETGWLD